MNEFKKTISRGFTRKCNLGNFENADFFANYSEELPSDTPEETMRTVSALLYDMAKGDVEEAIISYTKKYGDVDPETRQQMEKTDWKLTELSAKVRKGEPIMVSEWEELTPSQQTFLHKYQLQHDAEMRAKNKDAERKTGIPKGQSTRENK